MKKRLFAGLMAVAMVAALFTGCNKNTTTTEETTEAETEAVVELGPSNAPTDYVAYYSFDEDVDSVVAIGQDTTQSGADILYENGSENKYIGGVRGNAIYLDGTYGYQLTDITGLDSKSYTVSFWLYATRFSNYMPTVQFGPDIHGDVTGGQHYLSLTSAEWTGSATYPCVWSYDQLNDALWPAWSCADTGDGLKQWEMITLVVDENNVSTDGTMLVAQLYINGEEIVSYDSDGNVIPINVINNAMEKSDNFEFMLGVNYWDSIFKGAFDELYVYDRALSADEVKDLFSDGDTSAAYNEPERVVTVTADAAAIASLGSTDLAAGDNVYDVDTEIAEGSSMKVTLKNWSDGNATDDNYYFIFKDADGKEVARLTADLQYSLDGADVAAISDDMFLDGTFQSWGNWSTWESQAMTEASVTATITYADGTLTVEMDDVDYNGTSNTAGVCIDVDDVASFTIGAKNAYVDILSIASLEYDPNIYMFYGVDSSYLTVDPVTVGNPDGTDAFWSQFSNTWFVPEGETKTIGLTVDVAGANNYNNVFAVLQTVGGAHSAADNENYAEYAVVRADNYGWNGVGNTATDLETLGWTLDCDWNWDTMAADMQGAHVDLAVTNNGDTAEVAMTIETAAGATYHQSYSNIAIDGNLFFCVGVDGSSLTLDSTTIGAEDGSDGFWTDFSDVVAVAPGTSVTSEFTVTLAGTENYNNCFAVLTNAGYGTAATTYYPDYTEYVVLRADNYGWGNSWGTQSPMDDNNWDWDTMAAVMQGAHVVLTVTNNGDTADVTFNITTVDGTEYYQNYYGINVAH